MQKMLSTLKWFRVVFDALHWRGVALAALVFISSFIQQTGASTVFDVTEIGTNLNAGGTSFSALNNRGEAAGGRFFFIGSVQHGRLLIYLPAAAYGLPAGLTEIEPPTPVGDGVYRVVPFGFNAHGKIVGDWYLQSQGNQNRGFVWD